MLNNKIIEVFKVIFGIILVFVLIQSIGIENIYLSFKSINPLIVFLFFLYSFINTLLLAKCYNVLLPLESFLVVYKWFMKSWCIGQLIWVRVADISFIHTLHKKVNLSYGKGSAIVVVANMGQRIKKRVLW